MYQKQFQFLCGFDIVFNLVYDFGTKKKYYKSKKYFISSITEYVKD